MSLNNPDMNEYFLVEGLQTTSIVLTILEGHLRDHPSLHDSETRELFHEVMEKLTDLHQKIGDWEEENFYS